MMNADLLPTNSDAAVVAGDSVDVISDAIRASSSNSTALSAVAAAGPAMEHCEESSSMGPSNNRAASANNNNNNARRLHRSSGGSSSSSRVDTTGRIVTNSSYRGKETNACDHHDDESHLSTTVETIPSPTTSVSVSNNSNGTLSISDDDSASTLKQNNNNNSLQNNGGDEVDKSFAVDDDSTSSSSTLSPSSPLSPSPPQRRTSYSTGNFDDLSPSDMNGTGGDEVVTNNNRDHHRRKKEIEANLICCLAHQSQSRCCYFCRYNERNCDDAVVGRWKIVRGFVLVLILYVAIYFMIAGVAQNNSSRDTAGSLALLSSQEGDGDGDISGPIPTIFSGNLQGSPLFVGNNNHGKNNDNYYGDDNYDDEMVDEQLRYLLDLLSPIVSRISEREGYDLSDYVASRRNDASVVIKGSPQHNALAWLSHAITCQRHINSSSSSSGGNYYNRSDYRRYDCDSLLSRSQLINRYVLATMYFAWNGKSWHDAEGWISYQNMESTLSPSLLSRNSSLTTTPADESDSASMVKQSHLRRHPSDICHWKGVICRHDIVDDPISKANYVVENESDIEQQQQLQTGYERIIELVLPDNNLVGVMSVVKEIGLLSDLEVLNLSRNHLEGVVPNDLGRLLELRSLRLSGNLLSGSLPSTISRTLSHLEVVQLEDNRLIGGLDGFRFAPPCAEAPLELSSDCTGVKPKVACPCCTACCGNTATGGVRGSVGKKETKTITCTDQIPASTTTSTSNKTGNNV